jgi:hypothetical protein
MRQTQATDRVKMIEYLLLLQIPFYIIAAGVWYIAWKMKDPLTVKLEDRDEDAEDEENVGRRRG